MSRLLFAFTLLFSLQATACPNLAGNFECKKPDGTYETITITQIVKNGVTVYNYNGSVISADNVLTPIPDDANIKNGTSRSWCDDNVTLKSQLVGKYWDRNAYFGDLTLNMFYSLAGTDLKQVGQGEIVNVGHRYPVNSELTCVRF